MSSVHQARFSCHADSVLLLAGLLLRASAN
jgi:hypothetical protein